MQVTIQGKQMDVGEALRVHVNDKIEDLNTRYFNHATDATVTFSKEGHGHGLTKAHISIRIGRDIMVMADASENEAYLSFDVACARVTKQLRRYKDRLRGHHDRVSKQEAAQDVWHVPYYVIDEAAGETETPTGDEPLTIAETVTNLETLAVSDAVMRLDLSSQNALLFRNAKHGELNLVYRRADGHIGWIDPSDAMRQAVAAE